jgi:hypothetical protein
MMPAPTGWERDWEEGHERAERAAEVAYLDLLDAHAEGEPPAFEELFEEQD